MLLEMLSTFYITAFWHSLHIVHMIFCTLYAMCFSSNFYGRTTLDKKIVLTRKIHEEDFHLATDRNNKN